MPSDDKYVVFKTQTLYELLGQVGLPPWSDGKGPAVGGDLDCAVLSEDMQRLVERERIKDAVVIRRQDKFASPCLLTYAAMIGMVGHEHPDSKVRAELLDIADYFQRQGELAGDEGFKLPDL